eukprot:TRINITY_DN12984_c0_g1_i1.p1 TRINITY_DN12984_c0_g1~~TRINITY_DN12984_c0_g1_i1.p1  ORF type:complete len:269 (-),score=48.61 TRINITY_DN12984_c0_g1_i1:536-1294(-)
MDQKTFNDLERRQLALAATFADLERRIEVLYATRFSNQVGWKLEKKEEVKQEQNWEVAFDLLGQDNEVQQRLRRLCKEYGLRSAFFKRTPLDYYSWPLSQRKEYLQAPSEDYLCKSIIMVNTHCEHDNYDNASDSKYYCIVLQYTTKLNPEKLARFVHSTLNERKLAKKKFNFRLAPEDVSFRLSGFGHNAVTPLGANASLPMIVSHHIRQLPFIWLGGGEVDVKWKVSIQDLQTAFQPYFADIVEQGSSDD